METTWNGDSSNWRLELPNVINELVTLVKIVGSSNRKDGRANPKIEEPDEENMGYDALFPERDELPETGADPEKAFPEDPVHPDVDTGTDEHSDRPSTDDQIRYPEE